MNHSQKTELTNKQISAYLYSGEDIKINNFLVFRQPKIREIIMDIDYTEYNSLISVFLVNDAIVNITSDRDINNYIIFCKLCQEDIQFNTTVKRAFKLFFGRDDIAVYEDKLFCGENYFARKEITKEDYDLIVNLILKFNNTRMPEKKVYATEKAKRIDEKMEKSRRIIRERESQIDSITPLMARVEARHPNAGNLLDKTIYQLRLMFNSLVACENYDASIILAPYIKDNKMKHWGDI